MAELSNPTPREMIDPPGRQPKFSWTTQESQQHKFSPGIGNREALLQFADVTTQQLRDRIRAERGALPLQDLPPQLAFPPSRFLPARDHPAPLPRSPGANEILRKLEASRLFSDSELAIFRKPSSSAQSPLLLKDPPSRRWEGMNHVLPQIPPQPQIEAHQGHTGRPMANGGGTTRPTSPTINGLTGSPGAEPAQTPPEDITGLLSDQAFLLEEVETLRRESSALLTQLAEAKGKQLAAEDQGQLLASSNEELRHEIKQRDHKIAALHRELEALRGSLDATAGKAAECSVQDLVRIELEKLQEVYEQELADLKTANEEILSQSETRSRLLSEQLEILTAELKKQAHEHEQYQREKAHQVALLQENVETLKASKERLEKRVEKQWKAALPVLADPAPKSFEEECEEVEAEPTTTGSLSNWKSRPLDASHSHLLEANKKLEEDIGIFSADLELALGELDDKAKEIDRLNQLHSLHTSEWKALSASQTRKIEELTKHTRELDSSLEKEFQRTTKGERSLLDLQRKHETVVAELAFLRGNPLAPKISLPRVLLPTTLTSTSSQTELSIVHEENGKEMIVDESRDYQAELIHMENDHYEREIEAVQEDNAYLMALLQEQAELMQQMKVLVVSVGINGYDKNGQGPWEALLRERVRVELSLRELLKANQEKVEKYELVVEERDAWKASTRQLEDCVFDLSQRNRKLEEAVFQLEDAPPGARLGGGFTPAEDASPSSGSTPSLQWEPHTKSLESLPRGSRASTRSPSPSGEGRSGNKAMTLSELKHMIQQQHGRDDKPQGRKKPLSGFIDFSKTGCPKCNKDLVLIV